MKGYIQRGMNGKLQQTGQSFAYGRQYDSQKTIECAFDDVSNQWYDSNCYEYYKNANGCNGDPSCQESIITTGTCSSNSCGKMNYQGHPEI
jgi:hypothetical protein